MRIRENRIAYWISLGLLRNKSIYVHVSACLLLVVTRNIQICKKRRTLAPYEPGCLVLSRPFSEQQISERSNEYRVSCAWEIKNVVDKLLAVSTAFCLSRLI